MNLENVKLRYRVYAECGWDDETPKPVEFSIYLNNSELNETTTLGVLATHAARAKYVEILDSKGYQVYGDKGGGHYEIGEIWIEIERIDFEGFEL